MLRGNYPATMDEKGRLKIPNGHLQYLLAKFGPEVFVTSVTGENVLVYPMGTWIEIERKLEPVPRSLAAKQHLLLRYQFYGQVNAIDKQGRLLIHPRLRESAALEGEVDVLGQADFVEIWNHARLFEKLNKQPFTDEHSNQLVPYGF